MKITYKKLFFFSVLMILLQNIQAQTEQDGIMMAKQNWCAGFVYNYNSWSNYWEGTFKRNNANLGTVSTQSLAFMGAYGITGKLNVLYSLPYVHTHASAGTLHDMQGLQDAGIWVKWQAWQKKVQQQKYTVFLTGGYSFPTTNYQADFLPLAIGLRSKTASLRLILDYQKKNFFVTGTAAYAYRDNIYIDRFAYYTTEMHYTNEVAMPNMMYAGLRFGYRKKEDYAEVMVVNATTLGGFDIRKNDMPFPSNKMNNTLVGINGKYAFPHFHRIALTGSVSYTVTGRNVGQATNLSIGVFKVFDFASAKQKHTNHNQVNN